MMIDLNNKLRVKWFRFVRTCVQRIALQMEQVKFARGVCISPGLRGLQRKDVMQN